MVRRHGAWSTTEGVQQVELIDVDPTTTGIALESSYATRGVSTLQQVSAQTARVSAEGHRVVAAINADTWTLDDASGLAAPTGLLVRKGELISGGRTTRPTIGFDAAGAATAGDVALTTTITLPDGATTLVVDRVNKQRLAGELDLYTPRWGLSTGTAAGGTEVVLGSAGLPLTPSGAWTATVAAVLPTGRNTAIPAGGLVLSAQGSDAALLAGLIRGATVTITTSMPAGWANVREAVSGREWLARDGVVGVSPVSTTTAATHPRTAVGIRSDGSLLLAAVDGRQPGESYGVTANDLATLLLAQGAEQAINLDGGGSTTAVARRPGDLSATLLNTPSDGRERAVSNALLVVSTIPTGPLSHVVLQPGDNTAVAGQAVAFRARGTDDALNAVPLPAGPVAWSMTGTGGAISSTGLLRTKSAGSITVSATSGALSGSAEVSVVPDAIAPSAPVPAARLRVGTIASLAGQSLTVSWAASTDVGSGVARYELRRRIGAGGWTPLTLATPLTQSFAETVAPGQAVQYGIRAVDRVGNASPWRSTDTFQIRQASETAARYAGTWSSRTGASYLGSRARTSRAKGATATYTFTGSQIGWYAAKGPTRGSATVYLDGVAVATVSLHDSTVQAKRLVYSHAWPTVGRHRIVIRVLATSGHPWVDVDGFSVVDVASQYPVLAGAGDISSCSLTADSATATLLDKTPGTVFAAGDLAYETGSAAQFKNCYGPTWGWLKNRTRPAPGNHDYGTAGAAPYFAYFGQRAGTPGQGWYAYDLGTWRIYSLNSNCTAIGGCGAGSPQEQWLKADLTAHPTQCVAAVWHHPLFSSGQHGNNPSVAALWQDLYDAGAELVLNGHDHDYERFAPQAPDGTADPTAGIREFVVGTGGASLRTFATTRGNSEVRMTGVHGILKLSLLPTSYTWKFVPVAGSTWTDSGSAACH